MGEVHLLKWLSLQSSLSNKGRQSAALRLLMMHLLCRSHNCWGFPTEQFDRNAYYFFLHLYHEEQHCTDREHLWKTDPPRCMSSKLIFLEQPEPCLIVWQTASDLAINDVVWFILHVQFALSMPLSVHLWLTGKLCTAITFPLLTYTNRADNHNIYSLIRLDCAWQKHS